MSEKTVLVTCQGADTLEIDKLLEFQGNLKALPYDNYQLLRDSILELGISFPFHVWKERNKRWIIDAHQRFKTLKRMRDEEKYVIPKIPVVWVQAKDRREAAKKVLAATSQYGVMSTDGLHKFLTEHEIDLSFVGSHYNFPEIDLERFTKAYYLPETEVSFTAKSGGTGEKLEESSDKKHTCPKCGWGWD